MAARVFVGSFMASLRILLAAVFMESLYLPDPERKRSTSTELQQRRANHDHGLHPSPSCILEQAVAGIDLR